MYAAIYGYNIDGNFREHLGNITRIEYTETLRVFDLSEASVKGYCDFDMSRALIYVIHDETGQQKSAGFVKNVKQNDKTLSVSFSGTDFKQILDTEVLLDFTQTTLPDFTITGVFTVAANAVQDNRDPFIAKVPFDFSVPQDATDTRFIADYTGQAITVNALKFLKVYLSYFGYFIKPTYNALNDIVTYEFVRTATDPVVAIKLRDFIHEKTSSDIKTNKVIATIKFDSQLEGVDVPSWIECDQEEYESASTKLKVMGTTLPDATQYPLGAVLRVVDYHVWALSGSSEYYTADNTREFKKAISVPPLGPMSFEAATTMAGNANSYTEDTVCVAYWRDLETSVIYYNYPVYFKVIANNVAYYKLTGAVYRQRPNLPEKIYTLGNDNNIYEGYAPDDKRIYPIVTKIFEAQHLSEAQINAAYELVSNRYPENVIITTDNVISPIDLSVLGLYDMVRVYDNNAEYKDLPISERITECKGDQLSIRIKLGFKKTKLTEIIKNDVNQNTVVKVSSTVSGASGTDPAVYNKLEELETAVEGIPTSTSQLNNDAGFQTADDIAPLIQAALIGLDNALGWLNDALFDFMQLLDDLLGD